MNGVIKKEIQSFALFAVLLICSFKGYGAILGTSSSTHSPYFYQSEDFPMKNRKDSLHKEKNNLRFAIKTNLLQGAVAFAPNLGFEYAISNNYTIELTGALNHWGLSGDYKSNKKLAHWILQAEYRYWLDESFRGHFFGVHALGGNYNISGYTLPNFFIGNNLMESKYRYDGWTIGGGISYGYHLNFAQNWGAEFNIGIGVTHLRYDKYDCLRCGRKLNTESKTYFGPTKAAISLIYSF